MLNRSHEILKHKAVIIEKSDASNKRLVAGSYLVEHTTWGPK